MLFGNKYDIQRKQPFYDYAMTADIAEVVCSTAQILIGVIQLDKFSCIAAELHLLTQEKKVNLKYLHVISAILSIYIIGAMGYTIYLQEIMFQYRFDGPDYNTATKKATVFWASSQCCELLILAPGLVISTTILIRLLNHKNFKSGY
jgi:hypothetical protein